MPLTLNSRPVVINPDKNIFNSTAAASVLELLFRRTGLRLTPDQVTMTYQPSPATAVSATQKFYGDGALTQLIPTMNGVPFANNTHPFSAAVTKTDWQGTGVLYAAPRTNILTYSNQPSAWPAHYYDGSPAISHNTWTVVKGLQPGMVGYSATTQPGLPGNDLIALYGSGSTGAVQFTGQRESLYVILEIMVAAGDPNALFLSSYVRVKDATVNNPGAPVAQIGLNWQNFTTIAQPHGTSTDTAATYTVTPLGTGPNGGRLVRIAMSFTGIAGNSKYAELWPFGLNAPAIPVIVHGAQWENRDYSLEPQPYGAFIVTGGQGVTATDYTAVSSNGLWVINLATAVGRGASIQVNASGITEPYLTVSASPTQANGSRNPLIGSVNLPVAKLNLGTQLPDLLVWSDNFPMSVDALATYLLDTYGYYLEDGEWSVVGDATNTPLVRGQNVNATLNAQRQFSFQATSSAWRWNQGSTITFQQATPNSLIPEGGMVLAALPPDGVVGQPYDFTFSVQGGQAPFTFAITQGTTPAPLNAQTGQMSSGGVALTEAITYSFIVQVTDGAGRQLTQLCTVQVEIPALVFTPPSQNLTTNVGTMLSVPLGISGGLPPYTLSTYLGALPTGGSLDPSGSGTATLIYDGAALSTSASETLGIQVTDSRNTMLQRLFSISVQDRPVTSMPGILKNKVVSWYEASNPLYGNMSGSLPNGTTVYDGTLHANLQVAGSIDLSTGIGAQDMVFRFAGDGSTLHALTTAYQLTGNFALMALVQPTTGVAQGQALISRGADANGGYAMRMGPGGNTLSLSLNQSGTVTEVDFASTIASNSGFYHVIQQVYDNVPEMAVMASTAEVKSALTGTLQPNTTEALYLGSDPSAVAASLFKGQLASIALFNDKLWSDERKWLYNGGTYRKFKELGYWPLLTMTASAGNATTAVQGTAVSLTYTLGGGTGTYLGIAVTGSPPPGLNLSFNSATNVITLQGTLTSGGNFAFTVNAASYDGQTVSVASSLAVSYPTLALSGTYPGGKTNTTYSASLAIAGGNPPYTNARVTTGVLPNGLTLSVSGATVVLSGTPTSVGTASFTVAVDSADSQTATSAQSVQIVTGVTQTPWSQTLLTSNMAVTSDGQTAYGTVNGGASNPGAGTSGMVLSSVQRASGKWYAEFLNPYSLLNWQYTTAGLHRGTTMAVGTPLASDVNGWATGISGNSSVWRATFYNNIQSNTITVAGWVANSLFKVAVDLDAGKIWLGLPGQTGWAGGGNPATGTLPTYSFTPDGADYYLASNPSAGVSTGGPVNCDAVQFVQPSAWSSEAPAGFKVWTSDAKLQIAGTLLAATVGVAYNTTLTVVGGNGDYSGFTPSGTYASAGLTATYAAGTITISGTPTVSGAVTLIISIASGDGQTVAYSNSINIADVDPYKNAVLATSPFSYWRLGETGAGLAKDSSGNGHDLTYASSGVIYGYSGLVGSSSDRAISMSGSNYGAMSSTSSQLYNTITPSVVASIIPDLSVTGSIVGYGTRNSSGLQGYLFYYDTAGAVHVNYWTGSSWVDIATPNGTLTNYTRAMVGFSVTLSGSNAVVRIMVNGSIVTVSAAVLAPSPPTNIVPFVVGGQWPSGGYFRGVLDEVIVWNRTVSPSEFAQLYTASLVSKVSAMLPFDGAAGSTTFTDGTGRTWTAINGPVISSVAGQYGTGEGDFTAAGFTCLYTPNSPDFDFGAADFTIRGWVTLAGPGKSGGHTLISNLTDSPAQGWQFYIDTNGHLQFSYYGVNDTATVVTAPSTVIPLNTRTHVEVTMSGLTVRIFINGVLDSQTTHTGGIVASVYTTQIGWLRYINSAGLNGYLDDLQVIKGKALHTANFTPPATAVSYSTARAIYDKVVAWWEFTENSGQFRDSHVYRNDLTGTGISYSHPSMTSNLTASVGLTSSSFMNPLLPVVKALSLANNVGVMNWVRRSGVQPGALPKIMWKSSGGDASNQANYMMALTTGNAVQWRLTDTNLTNYVINSTRTLADGSVYQLIGNRIDGTQELWINGTIEQSAGFPATGLLNTAPTGSITFGVNVSSTADGYVGDIGQSAVFSQRLTPTEVAYLYNSGNGVTYGQLRNAAGTITP